jgi:pimeloyl-ACP methyl ester carboxylesterase
LIERRDAKSLLSQIECPTLIGVGSDDAWAPVQQHREMAAAIPGATLVIFDRCGHMSPAEAPDQVIDALRLWLAQDVAR